MADYGCRNSSGAQIRVPARTENERIDIDLLACFGVDRRDPQGLSGFDRELLAAGFNNCVTHFYKSPSGMAQNTSISRKDQIIRTKTPFVNAGAGRIKML